MFRNDLTVLRKARCCYANLPLIWFRGRTRAQDCGRLGRSRSLYAAVDFFSALLFLEPSPSSASLELRLSPIACRPFPGLKQEDILQRTGLGTSSTFDLTAVGLPDAEVSAGRRGGGALGQAYVDPRCCAL